MATLKFIDSHNMVAFLSKPAKCEGFEQIATVKAKTVNEEVQLQALVDGKKVIITESTIRRDLQLEDVKGIDCLPNATIFEQLTLMGMVKNVDSVGKFLMYPRFVQVFLNKQVDGMSSHDRIDVTPSHTKKIFGNMKRVGKGFSGNVTPLFPTMMVQAQEDMGEDEAVNEEMDDSLERAATSATSLDADSGSGPRRQDTMGDTIAQTRFENVSKTSNDSLLAGVNTPQCDEDSLKLKELMGLCTTLQSRVLALETTKTTQAMEITGLERRVKKLERRNKSGTHKLKRLYKVGLSRRVESSEDEGLDEEDASKQGMIADIDAAKDIYLFNDYRDKDMFGVNDLDGDEVFVKKEVPVKEVGVVGKVNAASIATIVSAAIIPEVDITLAQALAELKSAKPKATTTKIAAIIITFASIRPKAKGLVIHEQEQAPTLTPIVSSQQPSQIKVQDKGKGIMVEEPLKMKKKDQVSFDEQEAKRLQAEFDEEERLAREKDKANIALTEE
ncbi:hypothetical protein Tco_1267941 [Tanacetum coccineum]